ncbi:MAG: hypothetical protein A2744_04655 [Candidatus Buchananbacteria bacterium RIFCSPHIGHO2_01_FULL_44_11]|uniref:Uncharacterized protein n=1 Tax=Candidatus Buchananbacteria bacterium RIFCSPHIGHO2_01_FULL_44_11 TaxID=1797535 RepID=A0A1G1Y247_9BACT|nr:MAG: hypothetical protein A2744_04655 [Candidatus Buchananbacteria bacterium RIFCSPHIGHO2_01_FULL_44_11]
MGLFKLKRPPALPALKESKNDSKSEREGKNADSCPFCHASDEVINQLKAKGGEKSETKQ